MYKLDTELRKLSEKRFWMKVLIEADRSCSSVAEKLGVSKTACNFALARGKIMFGADTK